MTEITVGDRTIVLTDETSWLVAADVLQDAGRDAEAALIRSGRAVELLRGRVRDARFCYFIEHPRGFANEYTVYVVRNDRRAEFVEHFPDAQPINRADAIRRGLVEPRREDRAGRGAQFWGGLFAETAAHRLPWNATDRDRLRACADDTDAALDVRILNREARDEWRREAQAFQ